MAGNPNRYHDSKPLTVHQSTGIHKFTQHYRTHTSEIVAGPGGPSGHVNGSFRNTIQRVVIVAGGGSYTLGIEGVTTGAIAYNATPDEVEEAIIAAWPDKEEAERSFRVWGDAQDILIELRGQFEWENVAAITATGTSLTGAGASATVTVVQTGNGGDVNPNLVNDDILPTNLIVAESTAVGNICSPTAPVAALILSGDVVVPTPPPGSEEETRQIWRGHTYSSRIPGWNQS